MPGSLRWLLLALALTALPVAAGVAVLDEPNPATSPAAPAYVATRLADYDTSAVRLARAAFCGRLPDQAVSRALGGEAGPTRAWANGESAQLSPGVKDVAHEYGCRIGGGRRAEVAAWLFAPPVTRARAADLVDEAARQRACRRVAAAPAYGAPSIALVCRAGERRTASFRGLFGDAWLACSLSATSRVDEAQLLDRAGRWCVAVAEAASTSTVE